MEKMSLKELAVPLIKAIDSFNYLLKSHHRRTAVISYHLGRALDLSDDDMSDLLIAAALHDIGALSVQERNMLLKEDVLKPLPHCLMGYRMLVSFEVFSSIAEIISDHHIKYIDSGKVEKGDLKFLCHIIHFSDRVDILIKPDYFILTQKQDIQEKMQKKVGTLFHPEVYKAFEQIMKSDIFWIEIKNLGIENLFDRIDFSFEKSLSFDRIYEFATVVSRIIDFRSKFTASHSHAVSIIAQFIGEKFGFSDDQCKKLLIAGLFHDIGKLGIDPRIIEKNGPLTDDEYQSIKLHAYYTGQILKELNNTEWFADIVKWAENHHEKFNGTGYPRSIEGEEVDDGMKILSFSDCLSALMEDRPYRKSLGIEKSIEILGEGVTDKTSLEIVKIIKNNREEIGDLIIKSQDYSKTQYNLQV